MVTTIPETLRGFLLPFVDHLRERGFRVDAMAQGIGGCAECLRAFDHVWEVAWSRNPLDHRNLLAAPPAAGCATLSSSTTMIWFTFTHRSPPS